jgi:hypothetical protein
LTFLPFQEAREFVRSLKLQSVEEWRNYCKSGKKPDNIPRRPESTYKDQWKGNPDWLGTYRYLYATKNSGNLLSFEEAREFVRSLRLEGIKSWWKYCKSGDKPLNISASPHTTYKDQWKGYGDWLGTGRQRISNIRPFEEAREFARSLKLSSRKGWEDYCRSGQRPQDIPYTPDEVYKDQWKGINDWLGTEKNLYATKNSGNLLSFEEAREFVRSLKLTGQKEWIKYCKSGKKPIGIPSGPWTVYSNKWNGYADWLGTTRTRSTSFLPFEEAREFVKSLNLNSIEEWDEYTQTTKFPENLPTHPDKSYINERISWYDWLGKEETAWSAGKVKELLRGLIESNVIFQWDEAVLYSFLLSKGILNLNNRHKDFFKNLMVAGHTEEGRKIIEEYVDSDSQQPPDLSQFNSFKSNEDVENNVNSEEQEEVKEATNEDLKTLVNTKEEL